MVAWMAAVKSSSLVRDGTIVCACVCVVCVCVRVCSRACVFARMCVHAQLILCVTSAIRCVPVNVILKSYS